MNIHSRVGYGFDVHAFQVGDHIILGGIKIDYKLGIRAHSDGDVVIHALVDALLGAAALGDIGLYFPDTEVRWQNCESREFLKQAVQMLQKKNFSINNVDITIIAQDPQVSPYREAIRANLATDMEIDISQVNLKATTTEKLGFIGRNEGIAATAIVLIQNRTSGTESGT